jgi:hypothetical protein
MKLLSCFLATFMLCCIFVAGNAQSKKVLIGKVRDQHSDEPVPFASVHLRNAGAGRQADSAGNFILRFEEWPDDTLEITSVGYRDFFLPIVPAQMKADTVYVLIPCIPGKFTEEVVIHQKVNRGLIMWRRIVARKPFNDRYRFDNFSYELYNKLEIDLKNVNREKVAGIKLLKPFSFIFDNIDSSEGVPFLPAYLTESLSDYYFQKSPMKRREVFVGVKTLGIQNESFSKLLGGMDQVVNVYSNFIPVLDKRFVSPISDNGDHYYNYKVADTQYVGGHRLVHFLFAPKRKGENTFEGDCWVHDSTFAIQKMSLRLGREANVNFMERLSLIQEYQLIGDTAWFLSKDKFVIDVTPMGKNMISFIGRKTSTYRKIVVNDEHVVEELAKNRKIEETILPPESTTRSDGFWDQTRHEELTATEKSIYHMIDTLVNMPAFKRYTKWMNFIGTGYLRTGKFLIGPWMNWIYSNSVEGTRLRFDLGTNSDFSKKVIFHGYLAYGFGDHKWKGEADAFYLINKHPRMYLYGEYVRDFDYGQSYLGEISQDNIFALAIRKPGVPIKYLKQERQQLEFFNEWNSGFSVMLSAQRKIYDPVKNLPGKEFYTTAKGEALNSFETSVRFRFAYLEKFLENTFYRSSLGSPYPIGEIRYTRGIPGFQGSSYSYHKVSVSISNFRRIPPVGSLYFNVFGGRTFGTLPYLFLDVPPGNEIYYYNKYAFNMMNRFEYIHDRYAGFNIEHNFGNGLFRYIPFTRKLKFRQFWTAKALWGDLSKENMLLNSGSGYPFQSLSGKTYLELGTGVDNILKVLRLDLIWRPFPVHNPVNTSRFGVFGSFRFTF